MIKKFFKGFTYAFQGLSYAFSTQINFKVHTLSAVLVIILGCFLNITFQEWLWIILAISMVLIAELFNTAFEVLVNLISPEYNSKAGIIKDLAAGAVLLTAFFAVIIGLIIFLPKIF